MEVEQVVHTNLFTVVTVLLAEPDLHRIKLTWHTLSYSHCRKDLIQDYGENYLDQSQSQKNPSLASV